MLRLAIIIPTLNERGNVSILVRRLLPVLKGTSCQAYIVFVDDGSKDGTYEELLYYAKRYDFIHLLRRERRGLASAYMDGLRYIARNFDFDCIIQMDADLQHPPEKIAELVQQVRNGSNLVIASRFLGRFSKGNINIFRFIMTRFVAYSSRCILMLSVNDPTSGYRAMDKRTAMLLLQRRFVSRGFAYQLESLYGIKKRGLRISEVAFDFSSRKIGRSKLSISNLIDIIQYFIYSIVVRKASSW